VFSGFANAVFVDENVGLACAVRRCLREFNYGRYAAFRCEARLFFLSGAAERDSRHLIQVKQGREFLFLPGEYVIVRIVNRAVRA